MADKRVNLRAYWRLVRQNRNFRLLWFAQIVSELGDWLYSIAIYSLLLELTGSAKSVALAIVLQVLPQFFVSPAAGVVNDRLSRKRVMISADIVRSVIVLGMLFVRSANLVWLVYVLLLLETMMWAFFEPGRSSVIPNIVPTDDLVVANTLGSTTWSSVLAIGSALGGAVAAVFGRDAVFVLNALSFLVSASLLGRMAFNEPHVAGAPAFRARELADFSPVVEGFRYVTKQPRVMATLLVKAGLGLMGTHWVLLPIFGERVFPVALKGLDARRAGMMGMSLLMGSRGVGALVGPLIAGYFAGQRQSRLRMGIVFGFIAGGLGYMLLGGAPLLAAACAAVVLAHAGGSTVWVFSTTLLQAQTEDRFRGRVFSTDFAFLVLAMSIASYLAGILLDAGIPVRTLAVGTGLVAFIPAVAWTFALRLWKKPACT